MIDALLETRLKRGYKIVTIGGGTGLSTLLRGLKKHTSNLTAVVTVSDDGGSSGRLQKELGVLPPGDIRNCLVALADDEALVTDLFRYRFTEGDGLTGHSFGNLFLAAMTGITGNFDDAIKVSSRVLNIKGRVLPATLAVAQLCAKLVNGTTGRGRVEHLASRRRRSITSISIRPNAEPLEEVIEAIREADAIVLGPGLALHLDHAELARAAGRARDRGLERGEDLRLQRHDATRRNRSTTRPPNTSRRCSPTPRRACATS